MFYVIEAGRNSFRAEMASAPQMAGEALFDLEQYLKNYPLTLPTEEVKQAVSEGLSNAIQHGNRGNKILHVTFTLVVGGGNLHMRVENSGPGFDWRPVLDAATSPAASSSAQKEGGLRRLLRLGYHLEFNAEGTILTMHKPLPAAR